MLDAVHAACVAAAAAGAPADAEDIVQEAYLRAFKFFGSFRGENSRSWMLTIVRNTYYTWQQKTRMKDVTTVFDEELHGTDNDSPNPETILLEKVNTEALKNALEELPVEFREVLILRELEGFSYKEIAELADVPCGTVMSRLARARKLLHRRLSEHREKEN